MGQDIKSAELEAEQKRQEIINKAAHLQRIGSAALQIEQILLDNDMNWDEFGEVLDVINARSKIVFGILKLSEIKNFYDKHQLSSGSTTDSGAEGQTG